ncbi:MAG: GGDEF domain-containing protein [Ostreibacterium sp.]
MNNQRSIVIGVLLWLLSFLMTVWVFSPFISQVDFYKILLLFILIIGSGIWYWLLWQSDKTHWRILAERDELTQIANRLGFINAAKSLVHQTFCCVLVLDINNFKKINDQYGHEVGDRVLQRVAQCLNQTIRQYDVVCRWGGDEFLVLLKDADEKVGNIFHRRFQTALSVNQGDIPHISVTVGITSVSPRGDLKKAIANADNKMLKNKDSCA